MLKEKIKALATKYNDAFIAIRHHLHANPELSYQEYETSAFVQQKLTALGIFFKTIAKTGITGIIEGRNPQSRVIALRADMDALPITEENELVYRSLNKGVMHACGHDVHTTCLLGAVQILQELRDEWEGTVKFIFQPGEEKNPGGASIMIAEGVLEDPQPAGIVALHVNPALETGHLSFRTGRVMASADEIYITIKSTGGHAAAPHLTTDIILTAAQIVVSLQQVISRNNNPFSPSVLSICSFRGGNTTNVIPSEVKLMGTFRAMDETWRFKAHELIRRQVLGIAAAAGAEADINIDVGYPVVENDETLTTNARNKAISFLDNAHVSETEMRMGAEDFGFYTQQVPGCFYRLGVRNEAKGIIHNVHTPKFNIDEDAIVTGAGIMAWLGATL